MEPSGSAWIPPTSTFRSSLTSICPDLPLGDSLDGPWMDLGCRWTGEGASPGVAGGSWKDGMCPVTVTAPVTPDPRWNGADAPKQEQVSLSWEICSGSAAWNLGSGHSRLWIHTLLKSACARDVHSRCLSLPHPRVQNSRPARIPAWIPRRERCPGAENGAGQGMTGTQSPWRGE